MILGTLNIPLPGEPGGLFGPGGFLGPSVVEALPRTEQNLQMVRDAIIQATNEGKISQQDQDVLWAQIKSGALPLDQVMQNLETKTGFRADQASTAALEEKRQQYTNELIGEPGTTGGGRLGAAESAYLGSVDPQIAKYKAILDTPEGLRQDSEFGTFLANAEAGLQSHLGQATRNAQKQIERAGLAESGKTSGLVQRAGFEAQRTQQGLEAGLRSEAFNRRTSLETSRANTLADFTARRGAIQAGDLSAGLNILGAYRDNPFAGQQFTSGTGQATDLAGYNKGGYANDFGSIMQILAGGAQIGNDLLGSAGQIIRPGR